MSQRTTPVARGACNAGRFREAVCIDANRIFDACSDKDCLEDLQCFFTAADQALIDSAVALRPRCAEVLDTYITVEPIPFNKGFFAVDITLYFEVGFDLYQSQTAAPTVVSGLAYHQKRVVLYGSEGGVKTFTSAGSPTPPSAEPTATVKVAQPVALGCRLTEVTEALTEALGPVPQYVLDAFDGDLVFTLREGENTALVTLGVFTIISLERDVQIMVPVYDYSIPERESTSTLPSEDPCETFRNIRFPAEAFFPEPNTPCND